MNPRAEFAIDPQSKGRLLLTHAGASFELERSLKKFVGDNAASCALREINMQKLLTTTVCVLALSTAGAFAQSSQGKAGSDNGPISNSAASNGSGSLGKGPTAKP